MRIDEAGSKWNAAPGALRSGGREGVGPAGLGKTPGPRTACLQSLQQPAPDVACAAGQQDQKRTERMLDDTHRDSEARVGAALGT